MTRTRWEVLVGVVVILLLGVAVLVPSPFDRPTLFNPLVLPQQTTDTGVYHVGDSVNVTGIKCNTTKFPVLVRGSTAWASVNPAGTVVDLASGTGMVAPGCQGRAYLNIMPAGVITATKAFFDQGIQPVTWRIGGIQTPLGHAHAVAVGWTTNTFTLIP